MARNRDQIKSGNQPEPEIQDVKQQKEKQENARRPLKNIKPVAAIAIIEHVRLCLGRDQDAVNRVKQQRQKYSEYLDKNEIRHVVNSLNVFVKDLCPVESR